MMYEFLETIDKRKIRIIKLLYSNENKELSLQEISRTLNISERTVELAIKQINHDFFSLEIDANIFEKYNRIVQLYIANSDFSIQKMNIFYIKKSTIYKFLCIIFNGDYGGVKDASSTLNISQASLYRRIDALNDVLKEYDIQFKSNDDNLLIGKEENIRIFMFQFYWNSKAQEEWPFSEKLHKRAMLFYDAVEADELVEQSIVFKNRILLWIGVIFRRQDEGFFLSQEFERRASDVILGNLNYKSYHKRYEKLNFELDEIEIKFLYIITITDSLYSDHDNFMASTLRFEYKERPVYEKMGLNFIQTLLENTDKNMNDIEFITLYRRLLSINLYNYCFLETSTFFVDDEEQQLMDIMKTKFPVFNKIYNDFFDTHSEYLNYKNKRIYFKYLKSVLITLNKSFFFPEVTTTIISTVDTKAFKNFGEIIQESSNVPVKINYEINENTDLIISDILIDHGEVPIYFINEQIMFDIDYAKILDRILSLSIEKR